MSTCAAIDCDNVVPRRPGPGRPAIYCSPACRPTRMRSPLVIDVVHPEDSTDGRDTRRLWNVSLRRGSHSVLIAENLGWPSASALANALDPLLGRAGHMEKQEGADLD